MQKPDSVTFGIFFVVTFSGHAIGMAIFVGLAELILGMPAHSLLVPYTTLLCCGLVFSPLLYWARVSREQPKSCALRFAIAMFLYMQVLMSALGLSAIRLHILSQADAVSDFGLLVLPFSVFAFAASYVVARQMLKAPQSG